MVISDLGNPTKMPMKGARATIFGCDPVQCIRSRLVIMISIYFCFILQKKKKKRFGQVLTLRSMECRIGWQWRKRLGSLGFLKNSTSRSEFSQGLNCGVPSGLVPILSSMLALSFFEDIANWTFSLVAIQGFFQAFHIKDIDN